MLITGNQAPLEAGLLRWKVLKEKSGEVRYFVQDADCPWKNTGAGKVDFQKNVEAGNYLSLMEYFPWSFGVTEKLRRDTRIQSISQTLKMPPSCMLWLAGPKSHRILYHEHKSRYLIEKLEFLVRTEIEWLKRLASYLGIKAQEIEINFEVKSVVEIYKQVAEMLGLEGEINSLVEMFAKEPPISLEVLSKEEFWEIKEEGRFPLQSKENFKIAVPRGMSLLIEFALRGFITGFGHLPYLNRVKALKDKYFPELKIKLVKVKFNWELNVDPIEVLLEVYKEKKKKRGQTPFELTEEEKETIRNFWKTHPTPLAYIILGGELNPSFEEIIL